MESTAPSKDRQPDPAEVVVSMAGTDERGKEDQLQEPAQSGQDQRQIVENVERNQPIEQQRLETSEQVDKSQPLEQQESEQDLNKPSEDVEQSQPSEPQQFEQDQEKSSEDSLDVAGTQETIGDQSHQSEAEPIRTGTEPVWADRIPDESSLDILQPDIYNPGADQVNTDASTERPSYLDQFDRDQHLTRRRSRSVSRERRRSPSVSPRVPTTFSSDEADDIVEYQESSTRPQGEVRSSSDLGTSIASDGATMAVPQATNDAVQHDGNKAVGEEGLNPEDALPSPSDEQLDTTTSGILSYGTESGDGQRIKINVKLPGYQETSICETLQSPQSQIDQDSQASSKRSSVDSVTGMTNSEGLSAIERSERLLAMPPQDLTQEERTQAWNTRKADLVIKQDDMFSEGAMQVPKTDHTLSRSVSNNAMYVERLKQKVHDSKLKSITAETRLETTEKQLQEADRALTAAQKELEHMRKDYNRSEESLREIKVRLQKSQTNLARERERADKESRLAHITRAHQKGELKAKGIYYDDWTQTSPVSPSQNSNPDSSSSNIDVEEDSTTGTPVRSTTSETRHPGWERNPIVVERPPPTGLKRNSTSSREKVPQWQVEEGSYAEIWQRAYELVLPADLVPADEQRWPIFNQARTAAAIASFVTTADREERGGNVICNPLSSEIVHDLIKPGTIPFMELCDSMKELGYLFKPDRLAQDLFEKGLADHGEVFMVARQVEHIIDARKIMQLMQEIVDLKRESTTWKETNADATKADSLKSARDALEDQIKSLTLAVKGAQSDRDLHKRQAADYKATAEELLMEKRAKPLDARTSHASENPEQVNTEPNEWSREQVEQLVSEVEGWRSLDLLTRLESVRSSIDSLKAAVMDLQKRLTQLAEAQAKNSSLESERESCRARLANCTAEIEDLDVKIKDLKVRTMNLEEVVHQIAPGADSSATKEQMERLQEQIKFLSDECESLKLSNNQLKETESTSHSRAIEAERKSTELKAQLNRAKNLNSNLHDEVRRLKSHLGANTGKDKKRLTQQTSPTKVSKSRSNSDSSWNADTALQSLHEGLERHYNSAREAMQFIEDLKAGRVERSPSPPPRNPAVVALQARKLLQSRKGNGVVLKRDP